MEHSLEARGIPGLEAPRWIEMGSCATIAIFALLGSIAGWRVAALGYDFESSFASACVGPFAWIPVLFGTACGGVMGLLLGAASEWGFIEPRAEIMGHALRARGAAIAITAIATWLLQWQALSFAHAIVVVALVFAAWQYALGQRRSQRLHAWLRAVSEHRCPSWHLLPIREVPAELRLVLPRLLHSLGSEELALCAGTVPPYRITPVAIVPAA